jgi:hypothetical protein
MAIQQGRVAVQELRVRILATDESVQLGGVNIKHSRVPLLTIGKSAQQILVTSLASRKGV